MIEILKSIFAPAQLFGYVGMATCLLSYQCHKNSRYFFCQTACAIGFTLQFLLLGAWSGMFMNLVAIIRGILFSLGEKTHKPYILALILAAFVGTSLVSVLLFDELWWIAVCVFIAQTAGTLSQWTRNGKTIRDVQLYAVSPLWLVNNIYYGAIGGIICEVFNMISVIVSYIRFRKIGYDKT